MNRFSVVKVDDKLGYVDIPSKTFVVVDQRTGAPIEVSTLNNVKFEDCTKAIEDDKLEEVNDDRAKEFIKQIEQLYDE